MRGLKRDLFSECNSCQKEAVCHEGDEPILVLAGPGSGKTYVITHRILYLLQKRKIPAEGILVLTFTREAAQTMQQRFFQTIATSDQTVNFGTFHSVFYQILKQSTHLRETSILTENDKKKMVSTILDRLFPDMNRVQKSNSCEDCIRAIGLYKNTGSEEDAIKNMPNELKRHFGLILEQYEMKRIREGRLDFDDMLKDCHALLMENPKLLKYWQNRFSHILIDEFQDVNAAQYDLIKLLAPAPSPVFAVGDDDQSIYGFRGAAPECMKLFCEEYHPKTIALEINYRSCKGIVEASQTLIRENGDRFDKRMKSHESQKESLDGGQREVILQKYIGREEQYAFLEACCQSEKNMAILFRTNRQMQRFALGLRRKGIPHEMRETIKNPYAEDLVQDIMAYLRLAKGDTEVGVLARVINKPSRYVSRDALLAARQMCEEKDLVEGLLVYYEKRDFRICEKIRLLKRHLEALRKLSPFPACHYVRKIIGYEAFVLDGFRENAMKKEEALDTLRWITEDAANYKDIAQWLEHQQEDISYSVRNACDRKRLGMREREGTEMPRLMTMHASKGLEFDVVYIPDCNERFYPYGNLLTEKEIEEERRLFYVGMTRAKKQLHLSYVAGTKAYPEQPSRFLKSIMRLLQNPLASAFPR